MLLLLSTGRRNSRGLTLIELMVVVALIPLLGFTVTQLDIFTRDYFNRSTRSMISEQEVEIALGAIARDILNARSITVYSDGGTWSTPVTLLSPTGNGIQMIIDDNNDIPPNPNNDDGIRYWFDNATGTIRRSYAVNFVSGGVFDAGQIVSRGVTLFELTQTVNPPASTENLPPPKNVIRVRIRAVVGQTAVERTRYVTSRALRGAPMP